jgi:WD40 repeat protein
MTNRAEKSRRRKRAILAASLAILAGGLSVMAFLWRQADASRRAAEAETRRAEASKLLTLAQLEVETFPTGGLAYYARSLELDDTPQARLAALRLLQRGPVARILDGTSGDSGVLSPDGRWLIAGPQIFAIDGQPRTIDPSGKGKLIFSADGKLLLRFKPGSPADGTYYLDAVESIERWTLPDLRVLSPVELKNGPIVKDLIPSGLVLFSVVDVGRRVFDVSLLPAGSLGEERPEPSLLGRLTGWPFGGRVDPSGRWLAGLDRGAPGRQRAGEERLLLRPLAFGDGVRAREVAKGVTNFGFSPQGQLLVAQDGTSDDILAWDLAIEGARPRVIATGSRSPDPWSVPEFSGDMSRLAMVSGAESSVYLWNLETPLDRRPTVLPIAALSGHQTARFLPGGQWLVSQHGSSAAFWPADWPSARVVHPHEDPGFAWIGDFAFSPDAKWIASCSNQTGLHLWPLEAGLGSDRIVPNRCVGLTFDATGSHVVTSRHQFDLHRVAIDASEPEVAFRRKAPVGIVRAIVVEATGRRAVSAHTGEDALVVWDLVSGESRAMDLLAGCRDQDALPEAPCSVWSLALLADGSLWSGGGSGVRRWDIDSGEAEWIVGPDPDLLTEVRSSPEGRHLLMWLGPHEPGGSTEADGVPARENDILWRDLESGKERTVEGLPELEGDEAIALGPAGDILAVTTSAGAVWLRRVSGGEPHLLVGPEEQMQEVNFSPDGRWVAARSSKQIWIWPVPDLDKTPFHLLPLEALLARIESLTNVRAVEDPETASGWKLEFGPFPGWEKVPTW